MCRWIAYSGNPIYLELLLFKPEHSLIDQSLSARASAQTTNGDGFGVGWYGSRDTPGLYKDIQPAWNDENLRDVGAQIQASMFLAHVRSATGSAIQHTNCHPFRHGKWLFQHNGLIRSFHWLKRELALEVAHELYPQVQGTTDSELMFYLALTFGLEDDPVRAIERLIGLVEDIGHKKGVENPMQMTIGLSDGEKLYGFRYSTERESRTLFHSKDMEALWDLIPETKGLFDEDARMIVSEPLGSLADPWEEIPEATAIIVDEGDIESRELRPRHDS